MRAARRLAKAGFIYDLIKSYLWQLVSRVQRKVARQPLASPFIIHT